MDSLLGDAVANIRRAGLTLDDALSLLWLHWMDLKPFEPVDGRSLPSGVYTTGDPSPWTAFAPQYPTPEEQAAGEPRSARTPSSEHNRQEGGGDASADDGATEGRWADILSEMRFPVLFRTAGHNLAIVDYVDSEGIHGRHIAGSVLLNRSWYLDGRWIWCYESHQDLAEMIGEL